MLSPVAAVGMTHAIILTIVFLLGNPTPLSRLPFRIFFLGLASQCAREGSAFAARRCASLIIIAAITDPCPRDIQRARSPSENIGRNGFLTQRFPGEHYQFACGL